MRVQILTSVVGGGHLSVARALAEAMEDLHRRDLQFWVDDLYVKLSRPPLGRFPWLYATLTRRYPPLWRLIFSLTNRPPGPSRLELLGDPMGGPKLGRLLLRRRPDAVVSVLPGVNGFAARSLARHGLRANLEVIVTDWADIHLGWISTNVGHYTVPTEEAAETCRAVGVPASAVSVRGFPVRRQFATAQPGPAARRAARERLGLPIDRFVLLAMIGTEGSKGSFAHLRALAETPLDAEIVVVCGRNQRLRRRVSRLGGINQVRAFGFVEEVAQLMLAADLLVTKPGGVTLAEAFCCHLPVIAFDPVPGQEEGNARYAVSRGAAELAESPRHLAQLAAELRWAEPRRTQLALAGAKLGRPTAAAATVADILQRVETTDRWAVASPAPQLADA